MLLHLRPNVITFRSLLHLRPNVITFRSLLHLGLQHRVWLEGKHLQSQTKDLGHEASSPLPPTFNLDNQVIFPFFVGENAMFSNID